MLPRLLASVLFLTTFFASASALEAQVTVIPNTGCPTANTPTFTGVPRINTSFGFTAGACNTTGAQPFYMLGAAQPFPFPAPPACSTGCVLGCLPIVTVIGPGITSTIPNNPALIGAEFCLQTSCIEQNPECLNFQPAHSIRILN